MKVVCIENAGKNESPIIPSLIKGNIYHVIDERVVENFKTSTGKAADGVYFNLIETGYWHHSSQFLQINDSAIDELELVNECFKIESE